MPNRLENKRTKNLLAHNAARRPIIAGNWKMNKGTGREATDLVNELVALLTDGANADVVICPPFTALHAAHQAIGGKTDTLALGAQDVYWKNSGAYTGQVSPPMLIDLGVRYVILGHSERRGRFGVPEPDFTEGILKHFGETDSAVNRKALAAFGAGLIPIICVGETLQERENNETDGTIVAQVEAALDGFSAEQAGALVFAYEPVWAIGTGQTCSAHEAGRVCGLIRETVENVFDASAARSVRIQYGGSMKADNAPDLLSQPDIDGGLIGGAALKAPDFVAIIRAASDAKSAPA